MIYEVQGVEDEVNILLRLAVELALRNSGLPPPQRVRLPSRALEWFAEITPAVGSTGLLAVYVNAALPQPVKIPCVVAGDRLQDDLRAGHVGFTAFGQTRGHTPHE